MVEPCVLIASCGSWYLPHTAKAFSNRGTLAGLWITLGNHIGIPPDKFRRAWPFQTAMLPLYKYAPEIFAERAFYAFFPLWKIWFTKQKFPQFNVGHALYGYGTELFDHCDRIGALKVLDCPNSHPKTFHEIWQRECDLWCPGEKVPVPQWMLARMARELERADLILCPSLFVQETMLQNGIPAKKCFVCPFGVDTNIFSVRGTPPEKPRFICVGTICLRKGHQYLFRAWEIVKRQLPAAELICVGTYKRDFKKERPKWEGKFTKLHRLSATEIADLLKTCTAFVFPSQEEGIARAQIEALASGVPVIGTHEAGTTTVVDDGIEGFIVSGRDPEDIAAAMIRIANRDLNQRMGKAAYDRIGPAGSWQQYGDRLLARYDELLNRRPGDNNHSRH
jgi:glycosyltransferase involved in cell wall biosynthesis